MASVSSTSRVISCPKGRLSGTVVLNGSKSLSNRALIIRHLCPEDFQIDNLSSSDDSKTLSSILSNLDESSHDCGHAGTTFRFLTAMLGITTEKEQVLTGSHRMKERPIGALVDALKTLGADINYMNKEGYPPLLLKPFRYSHNNQVSVEGSISSQFITALLLIAPSLPEGIHLHIKGNLVSVPYVKMTLSMMEYFGIEYTWEENRISVPPQAYKARDIFIEGDWSSASYIYGLVGLSEEADVTIENLSQQSLQADSNIAPICERFGVTSTFSDHSVRLIKESASKPKLLDLDCIDFPDIVQTLAVLCAGRGVQGLFTGLDTLRIKETDRIAAVKTELEKVGCNFMKLPPQFSKKSQKEFYLLEGKASSDDLVAFSTYQDHRMALAFSILGLLFPVRILESDVVTKSYPDYYDHISTIGMRVEEES